MFQGDVGEEKVDLILKDGLVLKSSLGRRFGSILLFQIFQRH